MFIRQGAFLFAVSAHEVIRVSPADSTIEVEAGERGASLGELFALGAEGLDEGAPRLVALNLGPFALSLEVTGTLAHGPLPSERVQPLPPFVAGLRQRTGIGALFAGEGDSVGFLLDPRSLCERLCQ